MDKSLAAVRLLASDAMSSVDDRATTRVLSREALAGRLREISNAARDGQAMTDGTGPKIFDCSDANNKHPRPISQKRGGIRKKAACGLLSFRKM